MIAKKTFTFVRSVEIGGWEKARVYPASKVRIYAKGGDAASLHLHNRSGCSCVRAYVYIGRVRCSAF